MEQEKRNQYILIAVVVILLFVVFSIGLIVAVKYKNKNLNSNGYIFNQVYFSECSDMSSTEFEPISKIKMHFENQMRKNL